MALERISKNNGGGKFLKSGVVFASPGDSFQGIYRDSAPGRYGLDVTFGTENGDYVLTVKPAVQEAMENAGVKPGDLVVITYVEQVQGKKFPKPWKKFQVDLDRSFTGTPENGDNVWG